MKRNFRDLSEENQRLQGRIRDMRGAAAVVPRDVAASPMELMDSRDQFATPTPRNPHCMLYCVPPCYRSLNSDLGRPLSCCTEL